MTATGYVGGGGGGTPSGTVVTETTFGQASTAGVAGTFSRGDHTHGTPAAPSVPAASGSVVSETAFGQSSAVGVATTYSRGDHTHGTPAAPASSPTLVVGRKRITSGDVAGSSTGGVYVIVNNGVEDFTKSVPCAVGDYVEVAIHALLNSGSMHLEYVAINGSGTIVEYGSTNTAAPAFEGDPSLYQDTTFVIAHSGAAFVVTAPMISAGNVTFGVARIGTGGSGLIHADTNYPFRLTVRNYGAVTVV